MMLRLTTLFLFCSMAVLFTACKKNKNTGIHISYTTKMGGVRNWHSKGSRYISDHHNHTYWDTAYTFPDTSFALKILNDSSVNFENNIFRYYGCDSAAGVSFFGYGAEEFYKTGYGAGLFYYFYANTIVYGDKMILGVGVEEGSDYTIYSY